MNRLVAFLEEIASNPVDGRRRAITNRKASLWMRTLALAFLAGVVASVAVWVYDWRAGGESIGA